MVCLFGQVQTALRTDKYRQRSCKLPHHLPLARSVALLVVRWFRLQVRYVKAAGRLEAAVRGSQFRTLTRLSYRHLQ